MAKERKSLFETWAGASFRAMLRFQWAKIIGDPRLPVLWMVEILLAVGIATSIALYLDPELNVVPFPWNIVAFILLVGMALWIHRRTRPFRVARLVKRAQAMKKR